MTSWAQIQQRSLGGVFTRAPSGVWFTRVVKMKWTQGRFTVTYADGQTYTEMRDGTG